MKILAVGEFDPCGVHLRQRRWLREVVGWDYRLAVHDVYRAEGTGADWWMYSAAWKEGVGQTWEPNPAGCDFDALRAFAEAADVIMFMPAIGQPWSYSDTTPRLTGDADGQPFGPIDWSRTGRHARRVAVFHGSVNLAAQPQVYARHYRSKGCALAATTLDYVHAMEAEYLPSIVDLMNHPVAPLRAHGERLKVIHTPTDARVSSTQAFVDAARALVGSRASVSVGITSQVEHRECLMLKAQAHVGFDHLRGSFSINSLENTALGLVNLVAMRDEYRRTLAERWGVTLPWPDVTTMDDVMREIARLRDDIDATRAEQAAARRWYETQWSSHVTAQRIANVLERVA